MIENMEEFLKERDIEIGYFTPEKDFNKGIRPIIMYEV